MAAAKMKKLRLFAIRSREGELLRELMLLGCVEISEPDGLLCVPELSTRAARGTGCAAKYTGEYEELLSALELLDKYAPEKRKMFSARPEISAAALLAESAADGGVLSSAAEINEAGCGIRRATQEEERTRELIEALRLWEDMDVPLELAGTQTSTVIAGYVGVRTDMDALEDAIGVSVGEAQLFRISSGKERICLTVVCLRELLHETREVLEGFGFSAESFGGLTGTAADNIKNAEARLGAIAAEKQRLQKSIEDLAFRRDDIRLCAARADVCAAREQARERILHTDRVVFLEGRFPQADEERLMAILRRYDCAWETGSYEKPGSDDSSPFKPLAANQPEGLRAYGRN